MLTVHDLQQAGDACSSCWHRLVPVENSPYGVNISSIIMFEGGNVDSYKTCTLCNWNRNIENGCTLCKCKDNIACPNCYSSVYQGRLRFNTCDYIHNLYMCNSPYNTKWKKRPISIGRFYARHLFNKQNIYIRALEIGRSFLLVSDKNRLFQFNALIFALSRTYNQSSTFWNGVTVICNTFVNKFDKIFIAIDTFFKTIKLNEDVLTKKNSTQNYV